METVTRILLGGWIGRRFSSTAVAASSCTIAVTAAAAAALFYHLKRRKQQLPFHGIPYVVPDPHWFLGHLELLGDMIGIRRLSVEFCGGRDGLSTYWVFGMPVLSCLSVKLANRILKATSRRTGHPAVKRHFDRLLGPSSLVMLNGRQWRETRAIVHRSLQPANRPKLNESLVKASIAMEQSVLETIMRQLLQQKSNNGTSSKNVPVEDVLTFARRATLYVFGVTSLGFDFGSMVDTRDGGLFRPGACLNDERRDIYDRLLFLQEELTRRCYHGRYSLLAHLYFVPTPINRTYARETRALKQAIHAVIHKRRKEQQGGGACDDDLIGCLLSSGDAASMSDDFLSDFLRTALFGGHETTAVCLANTIYLLAKYPAYQDECAKEALRVLGKGDDLATTIDGSKDLPFLSACLWESLRFYPPVALIARNLDRPMDIAMDDGTKVHLPEGTRCNFSPYWIHHAEMNFSKPDEFLPERWAEQCEDGIWIERYPGSSNDNNHVIERGSLISNLSFSSGARNCVGQPLAMRMLPVMLGYLLRSVEIRLVDTPNDEPLEFKRFGTSLTPATLISATMQPRG